MKDLFDELGGTGVMIMVGSFMIGLAWVGLAAASGEPWVSDFWNLIGSVG